MENTDQTASVANTQSVITCQNSQGAELRGSLLRLTRHVVVFEVYHPNHVLQASEVLSEFRIILSDRTVYSGRAVVRTLVNTGLMVVCEATLEDSWVDVNFSPSILPASKLREEFSGFIQQWQKLYRILPEYKIIVADMQSFLTDLRLWLEQVELGIRSSPSADRVALEQDVLGELGQPIVPAIDKMFERFEDLAVRIEDDSLAAHQAYMRRQLHPLMLASPFAYRTFQKPLGYAGDYEMVNMIVRNPYEGSTLFAKLVNLWFLKQPPAEAHRNRLVYLERMLVEETVRVASAGREARIFNLACGPAIEVQRFLAQREVCERAQFDMLDFNEETLMHLRTAVEDIRRRCQRATPVRYIKKAVHQILKEAGKSIVRPLEQQYDVIYCAGLFDYLPDPVCQRLMSVVFTWLAPGGLLLVTNVDPSNPLRNGMEHLLDWHLIYRNSQQFRSIRPSQVSPEDVAIKSDITGVNLFMEVRKDGHG